MTTRQAAPQNGTQTAHHITEAIARTERSFREMREPRFAAALLDAAERMAGRLAAGGTVYWCGNGGSASDSQHLAAELVGRFGRPGRGWPSIALPADSSIVTAAGNDFGFETVFARQVEALVRAKDVVAGISTSGASANVVAAVEAARRKGALTLALTGPQGGLLAAAAELAIRVPGETTSEIQTCHIAVGQLLCEAAIELAEAGDAHA